MYQVGYLQELYRDAPSAKHKNYTVYAVLEIYFITWGWCLVHVGQMTDSYSLQALFVKGHPPDKHIFVHSLPTDVWLGLGHATNIIH